MYNVEMMNSILSRVLSEEIARQENWEREEKNMFGKTRIDRQNVIKNIRAYMDENGIKFNYDRYLQV